MPRKPHADDEMDPLAEVLAEDRTPEPVPEPRSPPRKRAETPEPGTREAQAERKRQLAERPVMKHHELAEALASYAIEWMEQQQQRPNWRLVMAAFTIGQRRLRLRWSRDVLGNVR